MNLKETADTCNLESLEEVMIAAWFRQQCIQNKLNYQKCFFAKLKMVFKMVLIPLNRSGWKSIEMKWFKLQAIVDDENINNDDDRGDANDVKMIMVMMIN